MKATESVQITLQLLKYVMYVILLQNTLQPWTESWDRKKLFACKFRAALVSALISIDFILFDKVSLAKMVVILDIEEFCSPAIYF